MTPWTAARQASLSNTNSWSLLKLMSIESVMLSNHLILSHPLLLLPSIFPSIRVFSNESNSMKLWAMPPRATQNGWVMLEGADEMWSTGKGKPLQYSWESHEQYEKAKRYDTKTQHIDIWQSIKKQGLKSSFSRKKISLCSPKSSFVDSLPSLKIQFPVYSEVTIYKTLLQVEGQKVSHVMSPNFLILIFIGVELLYKAVLVSALKPSDSAVRIHISPCYGTSCPLRSLQEHGGEPFTRGWQPPGRSVCCEPPRWVWLDPEGCGHSRCPCSTVRTFLFCPGLCPCPVLKDSLVNGCQPWLYLETNQGALKKHQRIGLYLLLWLNTHTHT